MRVRAELPVLVNGTLNGATIDIASQGQATAAINGSNLNIHQIFDTAIIYWHGFI
jgi:hypothetical protein